MPLHLTPHSLKPAIKNQQILSPKSENLRSFGTGLRPLSVLPRTNPAAFCLVICVLLALLGGTAMAEKIYGVTANGVARILELTQEKNLPEGASPTAVITQNGLTYNLYYEDVINASGAGFDDPTVGVQAQTRFHETLRYLADILNESGTLDVLIQTSINSGTGALASAGTWYSSQPGFQGGTAMRRLLTDNKPFAGIEEIFVLVDFSFNWNFSNDVPLFSQFDFRSVILHELTHGLGFISLANAAGTSVISSNVYSVLDARMQRASTSLNLFSGTPPAFQGTVADLTSNDLIFTGSEAQTRYGQGVAPGLYAPATFSTGSSLSHWDTGNIVGGAVMEHSISNGEAQRTYAPIDLGGLIDLGYANAEFPATEGEGEGEGAAEGEGEGSVEGAVEGEGEGSVEGAVEGEGEGSVEGAVEGEGEGSVEGAVEGEGEGSVEGAVEGEGEGSVEGAVEGEGEGSVEGAVEGEGEGSVEGAVEGEGEGSVEGAVEGEGEGELTPILVDFCTLFESLRTNATLAGFGPFFAAIVAEMAPDTADMNGAFLLDDSTAPTATLDILGNALLDAANELGLLETILADITFDNGVITHAQVRAAWEQNGAQLQYDLGADAYTYLTTEAPELLSVLQAYLTLGGGFLTISSRPTAETPTAAFTVSGSGAYGWAAALVLLLQEENGGHFSGVYNPIIEHASYTELRRLQVASDADGDGQNNRCEYDFFMPRTCAAKADPSIDYVTAALDATLVPDYCAGQQVCYFRLSGGAELPPSDSPACGICRIRLVQLPSTGDILPNFIIEHNASGPISAGIYQGGADETADTPVIDFGEGISPIDYILTPEENLLTQSGEYYINIKTSTYPQGAIRAQIDCSILEGEWEGECIIELEGEGEPPVPGEHSADQDGDNRINLSELLRIIQFFNSLAFHCQSGSEDGFAAGAGADQSCTAHSSDYNPQDWRINLSELLRLIQFYNSSGYHSCTESPELDGFCVGLPEGEV